MNEKQIFAITSKMTKRMSHLVMVASWSSFVINSMSIPALFATSKLNYWILGVIIIIFLISLTSLFMAHQYFILKLHSRFLQKNRNNPKIKKIYIGKTFKDLSNYLKDDSKNKKEYDKLIKRKWYSFIVIFKENSYSMWIPFILNFLFFVFLITYFAIMV